MWMFIAAFIGGFIGYFERDSREKIKQLQRQVKEKPVEVGATPAVYGKVNEYAANQSGDVGISEPKTPQQLEWEEQEALEKAQLIGR